MVYKKPPARCTHLHEDALEVLAHGHAAQFDTKVADLEARTLGLDLCLLLGGVDAGHLVHKEIEEAVSYQGDRLVSGLQDREHGGWLLRVVQHVQRALRACRTNTRQLNAFPFYTNFRLNQVFALR